MDENSEGTRSSIKKHSKVRMSMLSMSSVVVLNQMKNIESNKAAFHVHTPFRESNI